MHAPQQTGDPTEAIEDGFTMVGKNGRKDKGKGRENQAPPTPAHPPTTTTLTVTPAADATSSTTREPPHTPTLTCPETGMVVEMDLGDFFTQMVTS
ncbi:hypothetical protein VKT23_015508 [Stygiomarasmius scandens]|uniref:Uncharacterized protein n=1 Tax=Marasmiellus scandens TaxID=2682957 RepID=A0ABR1J0E4_9AGAR